MANHLMIYLDLTFHSMLPVALGLICGYLAKRCSRHGLAAVVWQGLVFGAAALLAVLHPVTPEIGPAFDSRSIMISLCALFFSPLAVITAGAMAMAGTLWLAGAGMLSGLLTILSSAAIGLGARFFLKPQAKPPSTWSLYLFGVAVQLVMLGLMITLPENTGSAWVMRTGLPVMLLFPLATVMAGRLLSEPLPAKHENAEPRDREIFLNTLFDAIPLPVFYKDKEGRYLGFNTAFAEFFGAKRQQLIGKTVFDTHSPELAKIHSNRDAELFEHGRAQPYESQVKNAQGVLHDVIIHKAVFTDNSGAVSGLVGTILDITESKRAQEKLQKERSLLRCLIDSATDLIFIKDREGVYQGCNKASELIIGIPESEQIGKTDFDFFDRKKAEEVRQIDRRVLEEGKPLRFEEWVIRPDGVRMLMDTLKAPYYGPDGQVLGLVGIGRDITERRRAVEERLAHLRFFENMDQINRAIQQASDLNRMMGDVLNAILTIFDCDRVFLLYPCDPLAPTFRAIAEACKPQFPGAFLLNMEIPLTASQVKAFHAVLQRELPVVMASDDCKRLMLETPVFKDNNFAVPQSALLMALRPRTGAAWMLGLHQCSHERVWDQEDQRLLQEIGRRLGDGLTSMLTHRDLHESEAKLAEAQRIAQLGYWDLDYEADRTSLSNEARRIFGLQPDEHFTNLAQWHERWLGLIHPEDRQKMARLADATLHRDTHYDVEYRVLWTNGEMRVVHAQGEMTRDASGRSRRIFGTMQDITERKRAEQIMQARLRLMQFADSHSLEELLQATLDEVEALTSSNIGFYHFLDGDQKMLTLQAWSTHTLAEMCTAEGRGRHYSVDEAGVWVDCVRTRQTVIHNDYASLPHRKGIPPGHAPVVRELVTPVFRAEKIVAILGVGNKPWNYDQNDVKATAMLADFAWDIVERKQAVETLRQREAFIRNILDSVDEGFIVVDRQYRILSASRAYCQMVKSSEQQVIGRLCYEVTHRDARPCFESDEACPVRQTFATGTSHFVTHTHVNESGAKQHMELKAYPIVDGSKTVVSVIETITDVTEKRKMEEQLSQGQKLEAIGRLAGGVAHDFNNMLGVIIGHAELALERLNPELPLFSDLQEIRKAAEHSADLTRQLLTFARQQTVTPKVLDLNETVQAMYKMLGRLIGENIELTFLPGEGLWRVKVDPFQIDQILANLCVNARDAISGVGQVTIQTLNSTIDKIYGASHMEVAPGQYVQLCVSDTGCGMDKETVDRLFEPFFTTKEMGKGTGLGLATVYGIIKQNNGFINVYSEQGQGSAFKIYLPRHEDQPGQVQQQALTAPAVMGHETILVVEDELSILNMATAMLERYGYRVLCALTPTEAVRLATEHAGEIHLLITDVVMPEMNGRDLAKKLIPLCPQIKCLYMSGYSGDIIAEHGLLDAGILFIQKPFSMQALGAKVREALDGK